jgi:A/G-specific adenine glycosylase
MNRADAASDAGSGELVAVRRALLDHYDRCRRDLPWRGETDPYRVLVSEVMLQQTRVETVTRYYGPWLERFPDVVALADADEGAVLKVWEGLGYYRRARNLLRTARVVRERPDASLPSTYAELRELPGVGEYTAGAVASIAFGEPVPAADGNVRRVLSRLFDVEDPRPAWVRDTAARLVDRERPGDWNQALMELGATVCTPRAAHCEVCPVEPWCAARRAGTVADRPGGPARREPRRATIVLVVLRHDGRVLLERRPPGGLLGGLWAFPEQEVPAAVGDADAPRAALEVARALGARPRGPVLRLPAFEHRFTHLHATYLPFVIEGATGAAVLLPDTGTSDRRHLAWVTPGEPTPLALPTAQRRLLDRLAETGVAP